MTRWKNWNKNNTTRISRDATWGNLPELGLKKVPVSEYIFFSTNLSLHPPRPRSGRTDPLHHRRHQSRGCLFYLRGGDRRQIRTASSVVERGSQQTLAEFLRQQRRWRGLWRHLCGPGIVAGKSISSWDGAASRLQAPPPLHKHPWQFTAGNFRHLMLTA